MTWDETKEKIIKDIKATMDVIFKDPPLTDNEKDILIMAALLKLNANEKFRNETLRTD